MNLSTIYRVGAVVLVAMLLVAAWGLVQVGPEAQVPIHWGPSGEPDEYAAAWISFLVMPVLAGAMIALFAVIPRIEPRRANLQRSGPAYRTTAVAVILLLGAVQVAIVLAGVTGSFPVSTLVSIGIGVLFIVLGNVLTTVRPTFMFGVRTPWTLTSDLSWDRTHRVVGRLFVLLGVLLVVVSIPGRMELVLAVMLASIALILVIAFGYSYRVWKTDPDKRGFGAGRDEGSAA
jgi:uncharacterized membrane protein